MGCASSAEVVDTANPKRRVANYAKRGDAAEEGGARQRSLMRRTSSKITRLSDCASSRTSKFLEGSQRSFHETLGTSIEIPGAALSSKLGSGRFSSPRLGGIASSPRILSPGSGKPPFAPVQARNMGAVAERRASVGVFADVPSDDQMRARIAAAVEKARALHGVDGTVPLLKAHEQRAAARAGFATLGVHGIARIFDWMSTCAKHQSDGTSQSANALSTSTTVHHSAEPCTAGDEPAEDAASPKIGGGGDDLLPGQLPLGNSGMCDELFESECYLTLTSSGRALPRLTEENLRQHSATAPSRVPAAVYSVRLC